jgi:hypothetical protein
MGAFLAFLLQGLPFVGKVVDAFSTYTNKKMDTEVEKLKTNGQVDVSIIQARAALAATMKDDPATKYGRWFFIVPTGLFYCATMWDSTGVARELYTFNTLKIPEWMQYMPYAVVAYLFVSAWRK